MSIIRSGIKLLITPIVLLESFYLHLYHILIFRIKKIEYTKMPVLRGKIIVYNDGRCLIGDNVIFNSSITSNLVGLNKPCTIAVKKGAQLIIGNHTGFSGVSIFCSCSIHIGNYVNVGGNVSIWDTDFHPLDYYERRIHKLDKINVAAIHISDDVFIGANSIILKGVIIGSRSIVGAGSVVTKSIPANEIWAGNPAKFIRKNIII